jgi:predicted secreted protein
MSRVIVTETKRVGGRSSESIQQSQRERSRSKAISINSAGIEFIDENAAGGWRVRLRTRHQKES